MPHSAQRFSSLRQNKRSFTTWNDITRIHVVKDSMCLYLYIYLYTLIYSIFFTIYKCYFYETSVNSENDITKSIVESYT